MSRFDLDFPRARGEPTATAGLRREPKDFFVAEQLGFELKGQGEHLYVHVRKTGANTEWVAQHLARLAGVRDVDVGYAGRKDRHAVTEQWFSVWLPGADAPDWCQVELEGVTWLTAIRHDRKLRRGNHAANRFRVRLRDMATLRDSTDRLDHIREHGFPNYFGEQRFGHDGNNLVHASEWLEGGHRPGRKGDLYLSAARAFLFNRELAARVADDTWQDPDAYGWLPGTHRRPQQTWRDPAFDAWYAGLERVGVKAMRRPLAVVPADLQWQAAEDGLRVDFTLPAGSYATSLLREFVDYRVMSDMAGDESRG